MVRLFLSGLGLTASCGMAGFWVPSSTASGRTIKLMELEKPEEIIEMLKKIVPNYSPNRINLK